MLSGGPLRWGGMFLKLQRVYQPLTDRIMSQLGVLLHLHFFKNARTVGTDRFRAQCEGLGDFSHRLSDRDQTEYLILSRRQPFVKRSVWIGFQIKCQLL